MKMIGFNIGSGVNTWYPETSILELSKAGSSSVILSLINGSSYKLTLEESFEEFIEFIANSESNRTVISLSSLEPY